jgi:hypothetical protein
MISFLNNSVIRALLSLIRFDFATFYYHEFQYGSIALMAYGNSCEQIDFLAKLFLKAFGLFVPKLPIGPQTAYSL